MADRRYINVGCGFDAPEDWINFDASATLRFERLPLIGRLYTRNSQRFPANVGYGNIVKGLPGIANNSVDGIYCSHVLEHLCLDEMEPTLRHIYEYLRPGGIFRFVMPDIREKATIYLAMEEPDASERFMSWTLGVKSRPTGLRGLAQLALGRSAHMWMWDARAMEARLKGHGFTDIRAAAAGDSEDGAFNKVEIASRFRSR